MSALSTISNSENVSPTKINAVINTVNNTIGGNAGQLQAKSSNSDFDTIWVGSPFKVVSSTSNSIGIGNKDFDITCALWDDSFGFKVKVYSESSPSNYMIGSISALASGFGTKTWRLVSDTINGSGTFTDWVITPINELYSEVISINTTSFPNSIFASAPVLTNGILSSLRATLIKNGKQVTINGSFVLNATTTGFDSI